MKYALNLDKDGRVLSATYEEYATKSDPLVEALPDGDISDYKYIGGEFILDPLPKPEKPEPRGRYVTYEELDRIMKAGVNSI